MIKTFRHEGLQAFFETGSKAGIQAKHVARPHVQLTALNAAIDPQNMNAPGWKLHFEGVDAILVDYQDYH